MGVSLRSRSLAVLAATVGFVLASSAVRALLPLPSGGLLRAKLDAYEQLAAQVDAVVIGTSSTAFGVHPEAFADASARAGRPLRAFNLGVLGIDGALMRRVLPEVLARSTPSLSVVLMEAAPWEPRIWLEGYRTPRQIWRHDPRSTVRLLAQLAVTELEPYPGVPDHWRARTALAHLELCALYLTNWGQGPRLVGREPDVAARRNGYEEVDLVASRGFLDPVAVGQLAAPGRGLRGRGKKTFPEQLARLRDANRASAPLRSFAPLRALQEEQRAVARAGARLVRFAAPNVYSVAALAARVEAEELAPLLDYARPEHFPEFYEANVHWSPNHLNPVGAELFSRQLAADVVRVSGER